MCIVCIRRNYPDIQTSSQALKEAGTSTKENKPAGLVMEEQRP